MKFLIEVTSKNVQIGVVVDASSWPRKTSRGMAEEALVYLSKAIPVALEGAPHVGKERHLIDVSPIGGLDSEADGVLGGPVEPDACLHPSFEAVPINEEDEAAGFRSRCTDCGAFIKREPEKKPVAPRVGGLTWEAVELLLRSLVLPPGTKLLAEIRQTPSGKSKLCFVGEDRDLTDGSGPDLKVCTVGVDLSLDSDEIEDRVLEAAEHLLREVALRDGPVTDAPAEPATTPASELASDAVDVEPGALPETGGGPEAK